MWGSKGPVTPGEGREEHAWGYKPPHAPGAPRLPLGEWRDTNRRDIATDGALHTLQTHGDTGATTLAETKWSRVWSYACGEGMRTTTSRSVPSWQGWSHHEASWSPYADRHVRQDHNHTRAGRHSIMGNHRLQRRGPIGKHNDRKATNTTIRQAHHYGNLTASRPHIN